MTRFIERHGLYTEEHRHRIEEIKERLVHEDVRLVRLAWADPHGYSRVKMLTVPAFLGALENGYNINVATSTLDSAGARTFSSFTRGGGMGLDEMTGSPNLTIVPDPASFRVLPWAPGVAWIVADEYFNSGVPFHFSPRQQLRRQIARLGERGMKMVVGLEIEWYLLRLAGAPLGTENIGLPGVRGKPVATLPVEPGYHYHSESNFDLMQPVISELAQAYEAIGLPLRSIENEWGPGQVECTFATTDALEAADNAMLFRTATRQVCRRLGHFATFMTRPAIPGYYSSGWHLHQSLAAVGGGRNLFMSDDDSRLMSQTAEHFLAGLLAHAAPATVFANPTVNGYRRLRPNSLAPDRITWAYDHRGVMLRVLGGPGDPATHFENRIGEPAANPYLYIASQIAAGLDGIENERSPQSADDEPYVSDRPPLPSTLGAALDALEQSETFRSAFGPTFIDYYLRVKRNELGRYLRFLDETGLEDSGEPTDWEHNEYFDFF
ncbi:MAG: hypothetical protein RLZ98_2289 [Pseudomonadota bacterium]|jgi:glutamine synthetase